MREGNWRWGQQLAVHFCPFPVVLTGRERGWKHLRIPSTLTTLVSSPPGPSSFRPIWTHFLPQGLLLVFQKLGAGRVPSLSSDPQPGFNLAPSGLWQAPT